VAGPVAAGLLGTLLPAFGYLPALGGTGISLEPWRALFETPGIWVSSLLSLAGALLSAALSLAIVTLFLAGWHGTRPFRLLVRLLAPLLSLPHAAAALGLAFLIAPSGLGVRLLAALTGGFDRPPDWLTVNDPWGLALVAGLVAKETPFLLLMALGALPQIGAERSLAVAQSLGAGRVTAFLIAVYPRLYPQLRLPLAAVLAYSASVVDVALILGPTNPPTLAVEIVRRMNDPDLSARFSAAAGAVWQLVLVALALLLWRLGEVGGGALLRRLAEGGFRVPLERLWRLAGLGFAALSAGAVLAGLASLAVWSFARAWRYPALLPSGLTLDIWARVAPALGATALRSLALGAAAAALATILTVATLEARTRSGRAGAPGLLALLYAPLVVPQVAFLFGLQLLFAASGLTSGSATVLAAHLVLVLPYTFLSLSGPFAALDPRYATLAATLGASPSRIFWQVRLPMLLRPVLTAAAVGFAVSIGLYLPTLLVGAGRVTTVTTEAVALAASGDRRLIGAWALAQALLPTLGFALALAIPALLFRRSRVRPG